MTLVARGPSFTPLGLQRFRILECLHSNNTKAPGFFDPPPTEPIIQAFNRHIGILSRRWADDTHVGLKTLLAAGRFLTGDIAAADVIFDNLPQVAYRLDHGHGICHVAHLYAVSATLPWPKELKNTSDWTSGSETKAALRAWLAANRNHLRWVEADGIYVF